MEKIGVKFWRMRIKFAAIDHSEDLNRLQAKPKAKLALEEIRSNISRFEDDVVWLD